jgi:hypothetical protein
LDNVSAYGGSGYAHEPITPWGVQAPKNGEDRPAEQRAARELELATTAGDDRGIGRFTAGSSAVFFTVVSVLALSVLGGLVGFALAVVTGVLALIYGLRSRRSAHYAHNQAWWLGTSAVVLTAASVVGCLAFNVLVPDRARGGTSCVLTNSCPMRTGG